MRHNTYLQSSNIQWLIKINQSCKWNYKFSAPGSGGCVECGTMWRNNEPGPNSPETRAQ